MEKNYPANLLVACFGSYDPSMNRLDPWLDVMQEKRNKKQIQHAVSVDSLICDVLSLSLASLDDRRKDILLLRYRDGKTLRECGEKYDISAERVRQLEKTAMYHIKRNAKEPFLSTIWPETATLSPTDWMTWLLGHAKDNAGRPIPYAALRGECKRLIITKVSTRARDVYNNAVKDE